MSFALLALLAPPVSLELSAGRLDQAVEALERASGRSLECAANLSAEVVVLAVVDRPVEEVMGRLAEVVGGDWETVGNAQRLVRRSVPARDPESARKITAWLEANRPGRFDADELARRMKQGIAAFSPRAESPLRAMDAKGPAARTLARAVEAIGVASLANLPLRTRVVYANRPTAAQRVLAAEPLLSAYFSERNAWAGAARRAGVAPPRSQNVTYVVNELMVRRTALAQPPARVLFEAYRDGFDAPWARVRLVDRLGRVVDEAQATLAPSSPMPNETPVAGRTPLSLSEDGEALLRAFGSFSQGPRPDLLPPDLRARMIDAKANEPMGFVTGETFARIARRRGRSLAVCLPDFPLVAGWVAPDGKRPSEEQYLANLTQMKFQVREIDGWLLAHRTQPVPRVDRAVLSAYLRRRDAGEMNLQEEAEWTARLPHPYDNWLPGSLQYLLFGQPLDEGESNDPDVLRFYGSLTPAQRRAAEAGMTIRSLTSEQRSQLSAILFGRHSGLKVERERPPAEEDEASEAFPLGDLFDEPTEALPTGLPAEGRMALHRSQEEVAVVPFQSTGWAQSPQAMTARDLAIRVAHQAESSGPRAILAGVRSGSQERIILAFDLAPGITARLELRKTRPSPNAEGLSGMSESYRAQYERTLAAYQRMLLPRGTPPP
jgi:hypothetical protein